jgi:dipeptidyl aminopeptidase/acylaminoacyl peptidase
MRAWALGWLMVLALPAAAQRGPLIPRELLFGHPQVAQPRLSPDGKLVGWRAPDAKGVQQLWVQPVPGGQSAQVTRATRAVLDWAWAEDSATLLLLREVDGLGTHLFAADVAGQASRDLTPGKDVQARLLGSSGKAADQVLAAVNQRDARAWDVHRFNLKAGTAELDTKNPGDVVAWAWDESLTVRAALARLPDGGAEVRVRDNAKTPWRPLAKVSAHENLSLLGFSLDGKGVYLSTSVASDATRLVEKNLKTGTERLLAASPGSDLREWLYNPWKMAVQAAAFERAGKLEWTAIETSVFRDIELLNAATAPNVYRVLSRDRADALWLVQVEGDRVSPRTLLWDRGSKKSSPLFAAQPRLEGIPLSEVRPVTVTARDGTALPALLTLPAGLAPSKLPLVLLVREQPWGNETWGFEPRAQFFANRGYAVLQVNFRGSTGFGKRLQNLGNRELGRRMQDDLTDAVAWAVRDGVADSRRVAIVGRFYGGYAALMGAALTPELYRCAVSAFAMVDLVAYLPSVAPREKALEGDFERRLGEISAPAEKARLAQASPKPLADRISAPLLLVPDVVPAQRDPALALAASVQKRGTRVVVAEYSAEFRLEDALDFYARTEGFLADCLEGSLRAR